MFIKSIDKYHIRAIPCALIVSRHARPFALASPRNFCPLRVSVYPERTRRALDSPFSFVFLNLQHSTLDFQPSALSNSFPHNSLSDPHPLNPALSILYKIMGEGFVLILSTVIPSTARDLLFPHFQIRKANHVPQTQHHN